MKVFISWSGNQSKKVAESLKIWISDVIQFVAPWISNQDIRPGSIWHSELSGELSKNNFGIICLTKENIENSWILFEAGSLAKSIDKAHVIPYLIGIKPTDVKGPLSHFQGVEATKHGTLELLKAINGASSESLDEKRLDRLFEKNWPELEKKISLAEGMSVDEEFEIRDETDYLKEILQIVRDLATQRDDNWLMMEVYEKVKEMTEDEISEYISDLHSIDCSRSRGRAATVAMYAAEYKKRKYP